MTAEPGNPRGSLSVLWRAAASVKRRLTGGTTSRGRAAPQHPPPPGAAEVNMRNLRRAVIGELAPGKTFVDVGGLWGTVGETVSIAVLAGAREATMIDIPESGSPPWARFHERCRELGVSGYHSVVENICNDRLADDVGGFDITHCSGVIYHLPNPINAIRNLISITRERLILTSAVVPERIANRAGTITLLPGQCLLVPALDAGQQAILREHFTALGAPAKGITRDGTFVTERGTLHEGPWWWLFTTETLIRMCELFNISIEQTWSHNSGMAATVLARLPSAPHISRQTETLFGRRSEAHNPRMV